MSSWAAVVLAGALGAAPVKELAEERARTEAALARERGALAALAGRQEQLLGYLDDLALARERAALARERLERRGRALERRARDAEAAHEAAAGARAEREALVAPALVVLDRLSRSMARMTVVDLSGLGEATRRARALRTMSAAVLADVRALDEEARAQRFWRARAARLQVAVGDGLAALAAGEALARERDAQLTAALTAVAAESTSRTRLAAELAASEQELAGLVQDLGSSSAQTSIVARRGQLAFPTHGFVEVGFGKVENSYFKTVTVQQGLDIRAAEGTPVVAVAAGTVAFAGWIKGYGNLVIVDHGFGYFSLYAHLRAIGVEKGASVGDAQALGEVGDSGSLKGPYLYFELRRGSVALDPRPWLAGER